MILRNAVNGGRLKFAKGYSILKGELSNLDYDVVAGKVDHPPDGSKDLADALCACTYRCLIDKVRPSEYQSDCTSLPARAYSYNNYLSQLKGLVK